MLNLFKKFKNIFISRENVYVVAYKPNEVSPLMAVKGVYKSLESAKKEYKRQVDNSGNTVTYVIVMYALHN